MSAPVVAVAVVGVGLALEFGWLLDAFSLSSAVDTLTAYDPEPAHIVGTGGAIGAIARHLVYQLLSREGRAFPRATLTVNVVGSFVFGAAIFAGAGESTVQLIGIGACGSFTTFSSFSVDTVGLWEQGHRRLAVLNAVGNLALSLLAIGFAWLLVTGLGLSL